MCKGLREAGRRLEKRVPCSTMPAVVPATPLTEAGAVVCRPTETQQNGMLDWTVFQIK